MNALQTLKELCITVSAFQAIEEHGIFTQVIDLISASRQASFCLEALSDIAMIEGVNVESWIQHGIIQQLDHLLMDSDVRTKESALFLLGALCANASSYKHIPKDTLNLLANCALSKADSIAIAAIHGVAIAFNKEHDEEHEPFSSISLPLFNKKQMINYLI